MRNFKLMKKVSVGSLGIYIFFFLTNRKSELSHLKDLSNKANKMLIWKALYSLKDGVGSWSALFSRRLSKVLERTPEAPEEKKSKLKAISLVTTGDILRESDLGLSEGI